MEKEIKLMIEKQTADDNSGTIASDAEEVIPEFTTEEKNMKLLEQINHKLDLLLSIDE